MKYVQKWIWQVIQLVGFLALLGTNCFGMFAQADMIYVTNADATKGINVVSMINTNTNNVVKTIPIGHSPSGIAINSEGTLVYVANWGDGNISVINTATNSVIATIAVGNNPNGVAINPAGTRVYVTNFGSNSVSVIDTSSNSVISTVEVGDSPQGISANSNGSRVYIVNSGSNTVSIMNTITNEVISTVAVGNWPMDVATNPSGTRIYVTSEKTNNVNVIDTTTNAVVATVAVGSWPSHVAINPSGTRVYVTNFLGHTVSVIDTSTNKEVFTIPVGQQPDGVAVSSTGTHVYVANRSDGRIISVIDTNTNNVVSTVTVEGWPSDIAVIGDTLTPNLSNCDSVTEIPVSECQSLLLSGNSIKATGVFAGTDTKFYGGVSKDRTNYLSYLMATPSSKMTLKLGIITEPADIGKQVDLLWVVGVENNTPFDGGVDTTYFVMDEMGSLSTVDLYNQPTVWMNQLAEKPFKRNVTLQKETVIDEINLGYPSVYPSVNYYFIGYRLSDGTLVYSQTPIISKIE